MTACKYCGCEALRERSATRQVAFDDGEVEVTVHSSVCTQCGRAQVTLEQDKTNKRALNEAKRAALGIPSRNELRKLRARWKMTQAAAGKLLGVGPTAFSKYENGEVLPAAPTARLLNVIAEDDGAMLTLVRHYGSGVSLSVPSDLAVGNVYVSVVSMTANITLRIDSAEVVTPQPIITGLPKLVSAHDTFAENYFFGLTTPAISTGLPAIASPLFLENSEYVENH
ncbi:type II TA system antitoxin MqsA family protein [Trinickia terrae]|nr:type II TA system antitoxin MqsA family protein [Trinickia terrae]